MGDRPMTDERLGAALATMRGNVAFPATPAFRDAVTARLTSERAAGERPRLPGLALWSRRRVLVLAAIGLLAALALGGHWIAALGFAAAGGFLFVSTAMEVRAAGDPDAAEAFYRLADPRTPLDQPSGDDARASSADAHATQGEAGPA